MTFRPPWWRCFLSSTTQQLVVPIALLIEVLLSASIGNWPVSVPSLDFVFVLTAVIMGINLLTTSRMQDRLTITISDDMIVRLAKRGDWGWPRIQFATDKVDCERTHRKPTMWQRLFGRGSRYLWSTDGYKIPIDYWAFTSAQVAALLAEIGCSTAER